jgi:hypothetical protein
MSSAVDLDAFGWGVDPRRGLDGRRVAFPEHHVGQLFHGEFGLPLVVLGGDAGVGDDDLGGVDEVFAELDGGAFEAVEDGAAVGCSDVDTGLVDDVDDQGAVA